MSERRIDLAPLSAFRFVAVSPFISGPAIDCCQRTAEKEWESECYRFHSSPFSTTRTELPENDLSDPAYSLDRPVAEYESALAAASSIAI
jgi:hypothetical protein